MPNSKPIGSIDIPFSVPFVHRLRETHDLGGESFGVLAELFGIDRHDNTRPRVMLVMESAVASGDAGGHRIADQLKQLQSIELVVPPVILEGGEAIKNSSEAIDELLSRIERSGLDRRSYIVAIGGGALLDAVGYAAAIAHRGIRLVRIPTTTLAQADSGVGVKNAINYFGKKNWVGTFAVPWAVINDARLLASLPDRDFRSGFSEAVKVSLLKSPAEFAWLCQHASQIRERDMAFAVPAIHQSCVAHLRHITAGGDPFEMLEARPLDFGHWSAHRLEPLTRYRLRHGEAVGIGVAIDSIYSSLVHGFPIDAARDVCRCLAKLGLPLWDPAIEPIDRLMMGLEEFRQHLGGRLTVTMLERVGAPIDVHVVDHEAMREAIERLRVFALEFDAPKLAPQASVDFVPLDRISQHD